MRTSSPLKSWQKVALATGIVLVASVGIFAGYTLLLSRDFKVICDAYSRGPELALSEDPAAIAYEISRYIDGHTFTRPARQAVNAIAFASADDQYQLLQLAASQSGQKDWECPAMREYLAKAARPAEPVTAPTGTPEAAE